MKIKKPLLSGTCSGIILVQFLLIITALLVSACYTDKKITPGISEMVVVFKKDIPVEQATSILFEKDYPFQEGMDSSKGKLYFKETGPKFIVQVPHEKVPDFRLEMKNIPQIYEVYQADRTINKD